MRLDGKVALVSGSTRGIGRTVAEVFAAEGAKVMVSGRTVEKGEKVVQRIREAGGDADFVRLDVTDENSVKAAIDATVDRFGSLTTLVNNAAPSDITYAALWLASDEAAFVTGSEVTVDGGQTIVGSYDEVTQTATKQ